MTPDLKTYRYWSISKQIKNNETSTEKCGLLKTTYNKIQQKKSDRRKKMPKEADSIVYIKIFLKKKLR
ncbi:MAG: hypothetical protein ACTHUJ_01735, partial [Psychrobacter sp.]